MTAAFTSEDLQHFIETHDIDATILPMEGHTPTVSDAARELGVKTDQIIKSLVFMAAGQPLLVIGNGLSRVDRKKLAVHLGVCQKKVKFATAEQAFELISSRGTAEMIDLTVGGERVVMIFDKELDL